MRRPRQTLAAALLLPLLAACGGAPQASDPPPAASRSEASASPNSTAPTRPVAIDDRSEAGAKAAVKWFLATMEYAGTTGDTSDFRQSFASSCTRCTAIADGIDRTYADGGQIEGGGWEPFRLKWYGTQGRVAFIDAYVNYKPQTFTENADAEPTRFPGKKNVLKAFQMTYRDGWVVGALDPEA